jgi:hypothetical protein
VGSYQPTAAQGSSARSHERGESIFSRGLVVHETHKFWTAGIQGILTLELVPIYTPARAIMALEIFDVTTKTQRTYVEFTTNSTTTPHREAAAEGTIAVSRLGPVAAGLRQLAEGDAEAMEAMLKSSPRIDVSAGLTVMLVP